MFFVTDVFDRCGWSMLWTLGICLGEDLPPLQLHDEVFKSIGQLYDCLLTEVHERCKKNLPLAKRLNASIAFFCYDLLSVVEPRQVFQLVSKSKCCDNSCFSELGMLSAVLMP